MLCDYWIVVVAASLTVQTQVVDYQCNIDLAVPSAPTTIVADVLFLWLYFWERLALKGSARNGSSIHWPGLDNWVSIAMREHKTQGLT